MLVLKVEFLSGVYVATRHNDPTRAQPEWPPHPDRLYSALVAAAAEGNAHLPPDAAEALLWLAEECWDAEDRCKGPLVHAPRRSRRRAPAVAMPSNPHEDEVWQRPKKDGRRLPQKSFDLRMLLPAFRKRALLPVPAVVPEHPEVYFVWPHAQPGERLEVLRSICERVTYLGRSRSLVHVTIEDNAPTPTHVPDRFGELELRVPRKGRLDYLIDKFCRDGGKPEPSPPVRYRRVADSLVESEPLRPVFDRTWIFQLVGNDTRQLPVVAVLKLTHALRRAILKHVHSVACGCDAWSGRVPSCQEAAQCYSKIPGVLSGYGPDCSPLDGPHVAFVPLPFVHPQQRHADGSIKGMAVLVPRGIDQDALRILARGLHRLEKEGLEVPGVGKWHLREVPPDDSPLATLDMNTWTNPSRTWTTATPMVFGHFPKASKGGEAKVVLDSLSLVGIDPSIVVELAVGRHSPLHGVPPSWSFAAERNPREFKGPKRIVAHVTIRFHRPVRGPIVIGALRYFGLGLMRPLEV